mgnify:FL=1
MDMLKLMNQEMRLQEDLSKTQKEVDEHAYKESMGGGAVSVSLLGTMQVSDIHISDEMMDPENREDLQDMLISCLNKAIEKAKAEKEEKMKSMTDGMNIPGAF